jgi:hypothetical protein
LGGTEKQLSVKPQREGSGTFAYQVGIKRDRVSADAPAARRSRGPAGLMNFPG